MKPALSHCRMTDPSGGRFGGTGETRRFERWRKIAVGGNRSIPRRSRSPGSAEVPKGGNDADLPNSPRRLCLSFPTISGYTDHLPRPGRLPDLVVHRGFAAMTAT